MKVFFSHLFNLHCLINSILFCLFQMNRPKLAAVVLVGVFLSFDLVTCFSVTRRLVDTDDNDISFSPYHRGFVQQRDHVRDPRWRPCISLCLAGCGMYRFDLKYCAHSCLLHSYDTFFPENYCFDFSVQQ